MLSPKMRPSDPPVGKGTEDSSPIAPLPRLHAHRQISLMPALIKPNIRINAFLNRNRLNSQVQKMQVRTRFWSQNASPSGGNAKITAVMVYTNCKKSSSKYVFTPCPLSIRLDETVFVIVWWLTVGRISFFAKNECAQHRMRKWKRYLASASIWSKEAIMVPQTRCNLPMDAYRFTTGPKEIPYSVQIRDGIGKMEFIAVSGRSRKPGFNENGVFRARFNMNKRK